MYAQKKNRLRNLIFRNPNPKPILHLYIKRLTGKIIEVIAFSQPMSQREQIQVRIRLLRRIRFKGKLYFPLVNTPMFFSERSNIGHLSLMIVFFPILSHSSPQRKEYQKFFFQFFTKNNIGIGECWLTNFQALISQLLELYI